MGGLKKLMPITAMSMILATFAIAGIFPFSGFFSKDEILWKVFEGWYQHGHYTGPALNLVAWILGMLGAFCTAFYMTRLIAMTFYGEYRGRRRTIPMACRCSPKPSTPMMTTGMAMAHATS